MFRTVSNESPGAAAEHGSRRSDLKSGISHVTLEATAPAGGVAALEAANDMVGAPESREAVGSEHPLALSFEAALENAPGQIERIFIQDLQDLAKERIAINWGHYGPCFRSVLDLIGMDAELAQAHPQLQMLLIRLSHHLHRAPALYGRKQAPKNAKTTSFIAIVRAKLDALPHGTLIPAFGQNGTRVSWAGLSELLGLPLVELSRHVQAKREVLDRVADGRLRLGKRFVDTSTRGVARRKDRARLIKVIEGYGAKGVPIPMQGLARRMFDFDRLLDEAGIKNARMRDAFKRDQNVRKVLRQVSAKIGSEHPADRKLPVITFSELVERGRQVATARYRETHPTGEPNGPKEIAYVRNEISPLKRTMEVNGWTEATNAEEVLLGARAEVSIAKAAEGLEGGARFFHASVQRWRSLLASMADFASSQLNFAARLGAGIKRKDVSIREFAKQCGVPYDAMLRWVNDRALPSFLEVHHVHRIEDRLGYKRGLLVELLGPLRTGRNTTSRKTIKMGDGRIVELRKYIRYLPAGALAWDEERLRLAVERADRTHFGAQTLNTVRQKKVSQLTRERGPLDRSAPIFEEWRHLVTFKTTLNDPLRIQHPKYEWRTQSTIDKNKNHTMDFARWAMTPQSEGGLGLRADQVSMNLFLNPNVVNKYVIDRTKRFVHLTLDGKEIGPILGGTEFGFLGFVKSLLDPELGFIVQSPHEIAPIQEIDVEFRIAHLVTVGNDIAIEEDDDAPLFKVIDAKLVAAASVGLKAVVKVTHAKVSSLAGKVERHYKMIRDPHALVGPILRHDTPVGCIVHMVVDALDRAPSLERAPMQHAREYRNAVVMLLLVTAVFRSGTLRNLTYRADGTGNLTRTPEGWDLRVEASLFKNGFCEWLFGPTWRRRDYERALGHWGRLTEIIDYYIETCRPILLKGRQSDLLFPTAQTAASWSHKTFNTVVTNWTRMWSVPNERFGTGMQNVLPFGPHAIRDIVATHIVLHFTDESRWELASAVLGTGVDVVKKRYAFVEAKRELMKVDPMYAMAFAQGFSGDFKY
ncbi:hypothetical protein [Sphingomonas morindae]|uniref:RNA-dependent RNA polymerase n=1 Tax=Sphingomonas morindae TaxID=1541170 RepID=A0ABY4XAN9_9SPHN|nr:hypothetical protein [Sphingomonas morindae]USI73938.1 hypothetical protein LHA26_05585 [Sphingomonas morindae]